MTTVESHSPANVVKFERQRKLRGRKFPVSTKSFLRERLNVELKLLEPVVRFTGNRTGRGGRILSYSGLFNHDANRFAYFS